MPKVANCYVYMSMAVHVYKIAIAYFKSKKVQALVFQELRSVNTCVTYTSLPRLVDV